MNLMLVPGPERELVPLLRPARPAPRRRAAWLAASALLHLLLLLAILLAARQAVPDTEESGGPPVEMVFEGPSEAAKSAAPEPADVPTPGQTEVAPTAPPDETATTPGEEPTAPQPAPAPAAPVAPPQPVAPPEPAPAIEATPEPSPAPAPPAPAPVEQAQPQPSPPLVPPTVRLNDPDAILLPPPVPVPEAPPLPPPPAPPRVVARPRPAPNPFAGTLMLGGPLALNQPPGRPMQRGGAPSRGLDLSFGPVSDAPAVSARYAAANAANRKQDWASLFRAWFEAHKYYPADAALRGEDGSTTVEITVDRGGHVQAVSLVYTSGSPRLDAALLGTLRGASVPAPLPGMAVPFTTTITLHYVLIR